MILVSSCLAGLECRYNGSHSLDGKIRELVDQKKAVMICPELLGGFSTPREPAEIVGGSGEDVLNGTAKVTLKSGADVTAMYVKGAELTAEMAGRLGATYVILKEYSPSCGSREIYDGGFSARRVPGEGVTAALLRREGYRVISEKELARLLDSGGL